MALSSVITYSVSRTYPYRWFTPVILCGGALFLALFSWLNFKSNGFAQRHFSRLQPIFSFNVSKQHDLNVLFLLRIRIRRYLNTNG